MPSPIRVDVTLETKLENVDLAEEIALGLAESAGFGEEDRHRIGMSVREAVINAHKYGNREERGKRIRLSLELEKDKMVIRVIDEGEGFDVTAVPDPLLEENLLRTSGRGIFLMRAFMDEFEVLRAKDGGAELVMAKRYPSHAPPHDSSADA
jgi:serine/threonine-protein kinase RsbW